MGSRYGRGKFEAHPNYIAYMEAVVKHPNFQDMPNSVSNGKINWQVSSGKTTSFYKYYKARWAWWVKKADSLGVPGKGNENERFTIAARMISPTGYRACRLCGEDWNVGYFYLNDRLFKKLTKLCPEGSFFKWQPIDSAIHQLEKHIPERKVCELFASLFPNRAQYFSEYGISKLAFEKSNHINSKAWLTPGYMGNPPDRLDGFHDYHFECRKNHDPGRFDENMKTYNHDRRSFEYWAEGNWMAADILYNSAGVGRCVDCHEDAGDVKISPDHIGPISCGFKQLTYYKPLCASHNSSKNRRFTKYDISLLIDYEEQHRESVASRQIRAHWDSHKYLVQSDENAKELSNSLRSIQDSYFRILHALWEAGHVRFICTLLSPEHAFDEVKFIDVDPSNLTFSSFNIHRKITPNRRSLFVRSIRIALESLQEYVLKAVVDRKLMRRDFDINNNNIQKLLALFQKIDRSSLDKKWAEQLASHDLGEQAENLIGELTDYEEVPKEDCDGYLLDQLIECLNKIGQAAAF